MRPAESEGWESKPTRAQRVQTDQPLGAAPDRFFELDNRHRTNKPPRHATDRPCDQRPPKRSSWEPVDDSWPGGELVELGCGLVDTLQQRVDACRANFHCNGRVICS